MELQKKTNNKVQTLSIFLKRERELETTTHNEEVYAKIPCKLSELNIIHTAKRFREKLKKLKQDYKKSKTTIVAALIGRPASGLTDLMR